MTATIIAISNQKGGVGKTTSAINIAASLAAEKQRILLIDLDPQGNATMGSGVNKNDLVHSTNEVLLGITTIAAAIVKSPAGYDLLPTNGDLTAAEVNLLQMEQREYRLKQAVDAVKTTYDFVIIDCPPSLNMLTINGLVAADGLIIPMQCEYYALEGLTSLMETVNSLKNSANPHLEIIGILRTMYDGRNRLSQDVTEQLFTHFGDKVYKTAIPRNVRLAEAPSHGLPVLLYDKSSKLRPSAPLSLAI